MKLIIISGPSGSGKTSLAKKILKELNNGIILNTDNYYKTGIKSKILSKLIDSYFDRKISFDFKSLERDLGFILSNGFSEFSYEYDFKRKSIKKNKKKIKNIKFVIVEGIFVQEVIEKYTKIIKLIILLKTDKETCRKRVINRDISERGKNRIIAQKDFIKSWEIFYKFNANYDYAKYIKKISFKGKVDMNLIFKIIKKKN